MDSRNLINITKFFGGFFILLLLLQCQNKVATESEELTLSQQVTEIMSIWPGIYNNDRQIEKILKEGEVVWMFDDTGEGGYLQVQSHYIKLDLPEVGDHVLYVEEYRNHQPDSTYRQRIYTVNADEEAGMVKVKMWPFKDKKKYVGAWKNPAVLGSLKKDELSPYPDFCDLHVKKEGNKYHMKFNGKDCAFGDKCFNYEVMLGKDMFSYRDKITVLSSGELITTAADFTYHDLNRIK